MTVLPSSANAGSTNNSFTFSYREGSAGGSWPASSILTIQIPAAWTAPQTSSSSTAGYVSTVAVGAATLSSTAVSGSGPWTVTVTFANGSSTSDGFNITYSGGGNKVNAPTTAGVNAFTTSTRGGSGGTLTAIGASPTITVNPGPLDHFVVTTPGTQAAGTAFNLTTITAQDVYSNTITSFTGTVDLTETGGGSGGTVSPSQSGAFTAGVLSSQSIALSKAGSLVTITATDHAGTGKTGVTVTFTVNPGAFTKLQTLLPSETASPGSASGRTGSPTPQTAGTAFNVTVNAVDANWNLISTNDTVAITSSDTNSVLPSNAALSAGTGSFNVTLNTATNSATVTASDVTHAAITANTSTSVILIPGALQHFAFGAIGAQTYAVPFNVIITARDTNNNSATNFTGTVNLTTTAGTISPAVSGSFVSGVLTQSVTVTLAGIGKTITATRTAGSETGTSGTFTVNQMPLTVTANNTNRVYGAPNPTFTASYSGFVNGDTAGVVQGVPGFSTSATNISVVGTYAITPSLGSLTATNYNFTTFSNGTLTITQATSTNVVSTSANPSPTGSNVTFTATLTAVAPGSGTPTGTLQFLADGVALGAPVTLSGGVASLTTNSLAHGTHTIAAQYAGDGNFFGSTNNLSPSELIDSAPVAGSDTLQRYPTTGAKGRVSTLLANDTDPEGDSLSLSSVSAASAQGGIVTTNFGWFFYMRPAGFTNADSFAYVITDGSLQATGAVAVAMVTDTNLSQTIELSTNLGNGSTLTTFFGIPGRTYTIQYTTNVLAPTWQALGTATADATGLLQYTDSPGTNAPARTYRSTYP